MAFKDFKFIRKLGAVAAQDFGRHEDTVVVNVVALHPKDGGHIRTGLQIERYGEDGKAHELAALEFDALHGLGLARLIETGGEWGVMATTEWEPPVDPE
jgi:hypothetical protein